MVLLFESMLLNVITVLVSLLAVFGFYVSRKFNFWKNRGVPYVTPLPFFGSLKDVLLEKETIGSFLDKVYENHKDVPYVGIFSYDQQAVVLRDLDLVRKVLVKDSEIFLNRVIHMESDLDPLGARLLFASNGERWRHTRKGMSPTFSSGKMKMMFSFVDNSAKGLVEYLDGEIAKGTTVEVKDSMIRFTLDVITSCGFGIESNSFTDPNAEFPIQLKKTFYFSTIRNFATKVAFFAPSLLKILRLNVFDSSLTGFLRETVWNTVEYREKNGVVRKDFLDSMMELRKKGNEASPSDKKSVFKIDGDDFVATAFQFLAAGFETSSSTTSFALYELSLHPDIQNRLRTEILEVLAKHGNKVTYEGIKEMKYLDMVVSETLRKYPILPFLDRQCGFNYELPAPSGQGTLTIPAGTGVYVPLMAIQYDPEYFPEPHRFDPERFTEEKKLTRPSFSYMPFGEGPRFCVGMRFGLMQTKTGLIHILSNFEVSPCKDTPVPLEFDKKNFLLSTEGGMPLTVRRLTSRTTNNA